MPEGDTGMLSSQDELCELEEHQGGKEKDARE